MLAAFQVWTALWSARAALQGFVFNYRRNAYDGQKAFRNGWWRDERSLMSLNEQFETKDGRICEVFIRYHLQLLLVVVFLTLVEGEHGNGRYGKDNVLDYLSIGSNIWEHVKVSKLTWTVRRNSEPSLKDFAKSSGMEEVHIEKLTESGSQQYLSMFFNKLMDE